MDFILPITMQFIVASPLIRAFGLCLFLPLEQKTKRVFLFAVLLAISFWNIPISGSALSASAVAPSMTAPTMCVEFIFGALLSMPAVLMYSTAILLGELIDGITGQSIARMMDPISHTETSTLGIFFSKLCEHFFWCGEQEKLSFEASPIVCRSCRLGLLPSLSA